MSAPLFAGMPSITLSDVARMRVETLSFFLLGFLVSAGFIKFLWNSLRRDFPALPHLGYGRAIGVVALWGLLFVLVLTMISGARELMTPGAWEKQGATYRVKQPPAEEPPSSEPTEREREQQLLRLRTVLWEYAKKNEGILPRRLEGAGIPHQLCHGPDVSGVPYIYVPGLKAGEGAVPVAYEPEVYGTARMVLLTSGDVRPMKLIDILAALPLPEKPR